MRYNPQSGSAEFDSAVSPNCIRRTPGTRPSLSQHSTIFCRFSVSKSFRFTTLRFSSRPARPQRVRGWKLGVGRSLFAFSLGLHLSLPPACSTAQPVDPARTSRAWEEAARIVSRIKPPTFPRRDFPITQYGARRGSTNNCTDALRQAIAACVRAGGGRVVVPAGEFFTGPIHLQSNVELHLEKDSVLKFVTNSSAYLPPVPTRFEGMECLNYSPPIYAYEQENVAITGEGTLDGQAGSDNWWRWKGRRAGAPNHQPARERLVKMVEENLPVPQRRFGEGDFLRPSFVVFHRCRNLLIEGVRIRRSPMWELHPLLCTNVTVRGVDIDSHGPNNDGCDPECCRDVLIEGCVFNTGDDCIAIKSGRNNDGRRVGLPCENVVVRGCTMKDGHGGVVIGSEISGGCRNVFAEDCDMDSPNLERLLRLKSNAVRGGAIENVFVRNIRVGQVSDAVLQIDFLYEEGAKGSYPPVARNVVMEGLTVQRAPRVLNVAGFPGAEISGVRIYNSSFKAVEKPDALREAGDVRLVDCTFEH